MSKFGNTLAVLLADKGFDAHDCWAFESQEDFVEWATRAFDATIQQCTLICRSQELNYEQLALKSQDDIEEHKYNQRASGADACARRIRKLTDDK